jgi:hypothetical protein
MQQWACSVRAHMPAFPTAAVDEKKAQLLSVVCPFFAKCHYLLSDGKPPPEEFLGSIFNEAQPLQQGREISVAALHHRHETKQLS